MSVKIKVKPCKGFSPKKPDGSKLAKEGEFVVPSTFWGRRIRFGEVEICEEKKENKLIKAAPKKEPKKEVKKKEVKKETKAIKPKTKKKESRK